MYKRKSVMKFYTKSIKATNTHFKTYIRANQKETAVVYNAIYPQNLSFR